MKNFQYYIVFFTIKEVTDGGLYLEIYTCYEANFCGIRNRVVDFIMMYRSRDIDLHRLPQISESKEIFISKNNFFNFSYNLKSWLLNARKTKGFDTAVQK